jgi:proline iminopeptidase
MRIVLNATIPMKIQTTRAGCLQQHLIVRDGHTLAVTVAGPDDGVPFVVLHGGPGSGSSLDSLRLFGGARVRVVFIDQRGAGASRPRGTVRHNDTARLIADMEHVRRVLGIERWGVLGGSWGAALALAYGGRYPERVAGIVLRGVFLTSRKEVSRLFTVSRVRAPREWQRLHAASGGAGPGRLLAGCARRLQRGGRFSRQRAVALAWQAYEAAMLSVPSRKIVRSRKRVRALIAKYRIQAHYLQRDCWLGERRLLGLARAAARAGVPITAVHGLHDPVCPIENVSRLAQAVPGLHAVRVAAGHLGSEPALAQGVRHALRDLLARLGQ